jgi:hypothetical protein
VLGTCAEPLDQLAAFESVAGEQIRVAVEVDGVRQGSGRFVNDVVSTDHGEHPQCLLFCDHRGSLWALGSAVAVSRSHALEQSTVAHDGPGSGHVEREQRAIGVGAGSSIRGHDDSCFSLLVFLFEVTTRARAHAVGPAMQWHSSLRPWLVARSTILLLTLPRARRTPWSTRRPRRTTGTGLTSRTVLATLDADRMAGDAGRPRVRRRRAPAPDPGVLRARPWWRMRDR